MALSARLNLRQSQSMTMTPQLLQSIKLLQLTHIELQKFIGEEVERNPLLTQEEVPRSERGALATSGEESVQPRDQDVAVTIVSGQVDSANSATPLENVYPDEAKDEGTNLGLSAKSVGGKDSQLASGGDAEIAAIEDITANPVTLRDHVADQIASLGLSSAKSLIAAEIADLIDERGFVELDTSAMAERLGCVENDVENVLLELQSIEPPGLFARNLAESLALQAQWAGRLDPAMAIVLENLELLAVRDFKALKRLSGLDETDLFDILNEIKAMSPHPGRTFEDEPTVGVVHDVTVSVADDGGWRVELNPDALPRVLVDRDYHTILSRDARTDDEKKFVSQCFADATWLERSLDQRASTILKVASEIVKRQDGFLTGGVQGLKPMTMRTIADAIDMHESTVSRVVANKYILTQRGLFEFRYFFTASIGSSTVDGDDHSSETVRQRIRQMVDAETANAILSDDAIADALKAEGMDIARRTVAKYRDLLHIPSSVQRRREKRALANAQLVDV
ncbi:MAG: RNA polymerase factor sigma-54 [Pseudomonadota bacterium]